MGRIADFIYELNKTKPTIKKAYFDGVWNGVVVNARLVIDYKTEVRLGITPEEIRKANPKELAVEVALKMEEQYRERMRKPH